jgi:hypothetical protein
MVNNNKNKENLEYLRERQRIVVEHFQTEHDYYCGYTQECPFE